MKINPIPQGQGGNPSQNLLSSQDSTASPSKLDRARAIANGQVTITQSDTPVDPQVARTQQSVRRIKMRTNVSPDRGIVDTSVQEQPVEPAIPDISAAQPVVEDTKPLSPQFAALAKQRRALQVKERELEDREKALTSQPASAGTEELVARLKSQPLSVLQEHGVTYDQLTEAILSNQSGVSPEILQLRADIKALKEGVDKNLTDRDAQAEQQVLAEFQREIDQRSSTGDDFALIRETGSQEDVKELIHRTFKETGEILDVSEAMVLVEDELINESLKLASIGKIRSKVTPPTSPQQQPQQKQIRTLTNRDTASFVMSRRDRALAAALGTLKK